MNNDFRLVAKETALMVIDMQNAFISSDGSIGQTGADMSLCQATVPQVKKLIEAARANGILDIWTIQEHYPDDITRKTHRIPPHTSKHCKVAPALVRTKDCEIIDELKPYIKPDTELVVKHRFSGFLDTRLETLLRMKGINFLIISGVSTPLCVETTTRDAYQRDLDVIVAGDAVATTSKELHENSLKVIETYFGRVLSTDDIVELMNSSEK